MGTQQVLRTGRSVIAIVCAASAIAASAPVPERVAVIDVTTTTSADHRQSEPSANAAVRATLARALVAAELEPITGDGVEHALAGVAADRDATALDVALADAERAVSRLACFEANVSAQRALQVLAARQASGMAVPELPRAWTYVLQCADRSGDSTGAMRAAEGLRTATSGAVPGAVPRELLAKYPAVDTLLGMERFDVDIATDDGAVVWVDFQPVGTAPLRIALPAGDHIVAAAKGARRGSAVMSAAPNATVSIELVDQSSRWGALASHIASWRGKVPTVKDLSWVLDHVGARIAVVRRGDAVQAWGRAGALETLRQFGGQAGTRSVAEADRVAKLVVDEVRNFAAHAPDSNRPLLVDNTARTRGHKGGDEPTTWWVYAAIGASIAAGALVIYAYRSDNTTDRLELRHP